MSGHKRRGKSTVERDRYNFGERLVNSLFGMSRSVGIKLASLDRGQLVRAAQRATGLERLGTDEDERHIFDGLDRMLDEANRRYTPLGHWLVHMMDKEALVNQLRVHDYIERHPEVLDVEIKRPVFVLGFPRTGTTLIQNLLSLPESRRSLEFWELASPAPLIDDRERDRDAKIKRLARILKIAHAVTPEMVHMHQVSPTSPEEDWQLFVHSFHVLNFDLVYGFEDYGKWLINDADMVWAYRQYKRFLQILLHRFPTEQIVLKCPEHLWFIDSLLEVFPDACIVTTHRDPVPTIASYSSMVSLHERTYVGQIDWELLGSRLTERFSTGMKRALEARKHHSPEQFYDLRFHELVADPVAQIHKVTEHFGLDRTSAKDLEAWLGRKRKDKRGAHRYLPERFGIHADKIYEEFAWYLDEYGVQTKQAA